MTYNKTTWSDRSVQYPMQFTASGAVAGTVTLTPNEGTIITAGTPITSANLNNLENGVSGIDSRLTTVEGKYFDKTAGGNITGDVGLGITPTFGLHQLGGSHKLQALANPSVPSVTTVGATGATSYSYYVVANDGNGGKTLVSPVKTITTGNATLSSTNYNTVSWSAIAGASSYDVLKTDTGHSIATGVTGTSCNDIGGVSTAYTAPIRNSTADFNADGWISGQRPFVYIKSGLWGGVSSSATLTQIPTIFSGAPVTFSMSKGFHNNGWDLVSDVSGFFRIGCRAYLSGLNDTYEADIFIRVVRASDGSTLDVSAGVYGYTGLGSNYSAPFGIQVENEIVQQINVGDSIRYYIRCAEAPRNVNQFYIFIDKLSD